jgi:UDPglucose--hexose-1-phosphate uridylyltransferase
MPEFRKDPIAENWVIIAEERGQRPQDFSVESNESQETAEFCPFAAGNEDMTPPEIYAARPPGSKHSEWQLRVVPNKYPALAIEGKLNREGVGSFDRMNGIGAHEVVIETPEHNLQLPDYSLEQMERVIEAYQARMLDLRKDQRFRYILVFKNHGEKAGASLAHPHSQVIALSVTPQRVKEQLKGAREHFIRKKRCIFCDILREEIQSGDRIVYADSDFVVWSPFAARFPFEMWILPREHSHDFAQISRDKREKFAAILQDVVAKLNEALQTPPYNFIINTSPNPNSQSSRPGHFSTIEEDYHWHLEIIPRISSMAGFEWGTGFYINSTPPEEAARFLREDTSEGNYF